MGRFVRLDPLTLSELPALYAAIGNPDVFRGGFGGGLAALPPTRDAFSLWAATALPFAGGLPFAVRLVGGDHDGELVGTSSLADFEPQRETLHLGWTAYDPRVWGTVVNAETKLLLLGAAFAHGFGRVKIQADVLNTRSRAAIVGIGATYEGTIRRERTRADGSWRDTAIHSILRDEWPRVREGLQARVDARAGSPVEFRHRAGAGDAPAFA